MESQPGRPDGRGRPGAGPGSVDHEITLSSRERATITGVLHVASFDDHEIVLDTDLGTLTVLGHDLQIKQLDLAQGSFRVEGLVDSLAYAAVRRAAQPGGRRARGGGMFTRLFR